MNKKLTMVTAAIAILGSGATAWAAQNYILHFQGRSWSSWQANKANTGGSTIYESRSNSSVWTDITLNFDGNARINNSSVDGAVNSNIRTYCGTATNNTCIIHCYSAGCMRAKKAITDIRAGTVGGPADTLAGLLYMEGSGNASGGTDLAEVSTSGFTGFLSKILGQQAAVDKDLTRSAARTTYAYIHTSLPVQFWNMAGHYDTCKTVALFVKVCGQSHIAGTSDGVVPWASSAGYSSSAAVSSMCSVSAADEQDKTKNVTGKYPKHRTDTFYETCAGNDSSGSSWDHAGIVNAAETGIDMVIHNASSAYYYYDPYTDPNPPSTACSGSQCDGAMQNYATNTTQGYNSSGGGQNNGASLSGTGPMTGGTTGSTTSCVGRCGTNPGGSYCRCDTPSGACSDYYTQHCDSVNQ